ncbi:hypothetical protein CROQUDRAFT_650777 [Cronartium quercuum f. sp. fusiforme G11]|uniref:Uncharacterized protein n=1 Tax=Cronartium quercuum f. sp. fusiforme G11 TaxID=708437 RepID=A0A9P6TGR9_9BASI|nr:hypothetical protein CROQUDRAFT_650777 [Cronartium quercuum f. sp. fusiforme G11]
MALLTSAYAMPYANVQETTVPSVVRPHNKNITSVASHEKTPRQKFHPGHFSENVAPQKIDQQMGPRKVVRARPKSKALSMMSRSLTIIVKRLEAVLSLQEVRSLGHNGTETEIEDAKHREDLAHHAVHSSIFSLLRNFSESFDIRSCAFYQG